MNPNQNQPPIQQPMPQQMTPPMMPQTSMQQNVGRHSSAYQQLGTLVNQFVSAGIPGMDQVLAVVHKNHGKLLKRAGQALMAGGIGGAGQVAIKGLNSFATMPKQKGVGK